MQDYLKILESISQKEKYLKHNMLFFEGEEAKNFYVLLKGKIRVYKSTMDFKEITLHYFSPISFIAEMPAYKGIKYPASAICEEESEVLKINFEQFKTLCLKDGNFSLIMILSLFEKIKILENQILSNSLSLKIKLARYLIENETKLPFITQRQIATDLNTCNETLSRLLKNFKNLEILQTSKGKVKLIDKEKIAKFAWN
ncbi:Crp/Fnr family transcriptional regulator [Campylobacter sp. CCS1377]|uniref:Crp/Fnr family transcriptional regulator n=1 Tax=Campylobacter sp. CCS1377 TaxID=3158229 RepID=A0AAU7E9I5_9BACT|nr:Crp/Fnr family transcriptional regulator [Campylobacter jejuni]